MMYDVQGFLQIGAGKLEGVTEPLWQMHFFPWVSDGVRGG